MDIDIVNQFSEKYPALKRKITTFDWSRDIIQIADEFGWVKQAIPGQYEYLTLYLDTGESFKFRKDTYTGVVELMEFKEAK